MLTQVRKKYATKEESLAARRERERARRKRNRQDNCPSKPEIKIRAGTVVARWRALQQQQDLANDTDVATFLMDR